MDNLLSQICDKIDNAMDKEIELLTLQIVVVNDKNGSKNTALGVYYKEDDNYENNVKAQFEFAKYFGFEAYFFDLNIKTGDILQSNHTANDKIFDFAESDYIYRTILDVIKIKMDSIKDSNKNIRRM